MRSWSVTVKNTLHNLSSSSSLNGYTLEVTNKLRTGNNSLAKEIINIIIWALCVKQMCGMECCSVCFVL